MLINTTIQDRIFFIEMQNSEHFNCLSEAMCYELIDALKKGYAAECVGIVIKRQFRILSKAATVIPSESFERINAYRTKVYKGEDYLEGIRSFLEKRVPQYKGKASDLDTTKHEL